MSTLTRAFTTRRFKQSLDMKDGGDGMLQRSNTTRLVGSIRHKISAPVELIHTTNMLSYNAPDLFPKSSSSSNSAKSDDESDTAPTTASTPPTSPDSPFPEKRPESPEPNHLSCYFAGPKQTAALPPAAATTATAADAPAIPQRAPSHTKRSYEGLVRQRSASRLSEQSTRSISTKSSFSFSRSSSSSTSTSVTSASSSLSRKPSLASVAEPPSPPAPPISQKRDFHKKEYSDSHPFGHELAQVSELAEEYGIKDKMTAMDEEEQELAQKGLKKFSAEDYLSEIKDLAASFFADTRPLAAVWI